jgi:hypothetical protein
MLWRRVRAVAEGVLRPSRPWLSGAPAAISAALLGIASAWAAEPPQAAPPPPGKALVYIYRASSSVGSGTPARFALDRTDVATLEAKTYTWLYVPENAHVISYDGAGGDPANADAAGLAINPQSGETYYYRFDQYAQALPGRFEIVRSLTLIPPAQAQQELGLYRFVEPFSARTAASRPAPPPGSPPVSAPASPTVSPPVAAPASPPAKPAAPTPVLSPQQASTYKLQVGDRLQITTFNEPENTGTFVVNSAGAVTLLYLGDIPARGRTAKELSAAIVARLAYGYELHPKVDIEVLAPGQAASQAR